jgi:hypothetical protein
VQSLLAASQRSVQTPYALPDCPHLSATKPPQHARTLRAPPGNTPETKTNSEEDRMSPREAIQFAREHNARVVDVKFTDLFGMWHHFSMPIEAFTEEIFDEASASMAPPSAASSPSMSPTCC